MGASKGRAVVLVLLLLALASAAQAQLWRGPAAIEVRAEDKGKPAAGGEVRLEFLDMEPPAGPVPVKLDSRGRAVVGSLAEGRWRVEVSREGAMTYRAEVLVRRDGKPEVIDAVQHNVPGAVSMMEVKLARAKGGAAPPPQVAEQTPPPQSVPISQAEPIRRPSEITPRPQPERPAPAQPVAPPDRSQPSLPSQPPAAPVTPPVQAPPVERPAQPVPPPPAAAPAPSPPSPGAPVLKRSFQDRTCVECRPGESSLSMEIVAAPSAAGCGDGLRDSLTRLDTSAMGDGCHLVKIDLPKNARFVGYRYEVESGGQASDCLAGKDCPAGGRWPLDPVLRRDGAGTTTVATAFENRGDRERRAVLTVYFTEGGGRNAPRPMIPTKPKNSGR
ncbi:MAG TPA: hypothetical protein VH394_08820 [Thermoanaerobaculia bacterium]|jgi:hypothetical protein|nr:hypothetical protein [Thermoanaerobaculia bacterium]